MILELSLEEKASILSNSGPFQNIFQEDVQRAWEIVLEELLEMYTHAFNAKKIVILDILEDCNGKVSDCRKRLAFMLVSEISG